MLFVVTLLTSLLISHNHALKNDAALTPPMGWIARGDYGCTVDCARLPDKCVGERMIRNMAARMQTGGWIKAGYHFVLLEDCWSQKTRDDKTKELVPDRTRFKQPMNELVNFLHSRNLKLGLTLGSGKTTCLNYPGSEDYMEADAKTLVKWGVDYVRMTPCNTKPSDLESRFEKFSNLLQKVGCQVTFACTYPAALNWQTSPNVLNWKRLQANCNTWRLTSSIQPTWESILKVINEYRTHSAKLAEFAEPGSWNDPDVLVVGHKDLKEGEQRVQMGMWSMFAAPLIMANDLCNIKNSTANLLKNQHLIEINQDPAGHQAKFIKMIDTVQLWRRKLSDKAGGMAIALLNVGSKSVTVQITLEDFQTKPAKDETTNFYLFDAISGNNLPCATYKSRLSITIKPVDILIYKLLKK